MKGRENYERKAQSKVSGMYRLASFLWFGETLGIFPSFLLPLDLSRHDDGAGITEISRRSTTRINNFSISVLQSK